MSEMSEEGVVTSIKKEYIIDGVDSQNELKVFRDKEHLIAHLVQTNMHFDKIIEVKTETIVKTAYIDITDSMHTIIDQVNNKLKDMSV